MNYFGIWVPKDAPADVVRTMGMAWDKKIKNSEALKKYAAQRSALFSPIHGKEAQDEAGKMINLTAWLYYDAGKAKISPDTVGIKRPGS